MPLKTTVLLVALAVLPISAASAGQDAVDAGPEGIVGKISQALSGNADALAAGAVGVAVSSQALTSGIMGQYIDFITIIGNVGEGVGEGIDDGSGHGHGSGHGL